MPTKFYTRLDRRHRGYSEWMYLINRPIPNYIKAGSLRESFQQFYKWREWCWTTWGGSKEIEKWLDDSNGNQLDLASQNPHWCWQNNEYESRIYLRSEQELSLFLLRWGS